MKKYIPLLVLTVLLFNSSVTQALTISPARIEVSADPGTTVTGEMTLINEEGSNKTFYSSTKNFEAQGESGTPTFTTSDEGLASWIKFVPSVNLSKGQEVKVSYSIDVPKDADPGGYFAAVFLSTVPKDDKGDISVGAKIGSLVLLRVNGEVKEDARILGFTTTNNKFFFTALPVSFNYRFNNNGTDRINPAGDITISNTIGMTTAKLQANPTQGNILPKSIRKFTVTWGDSSVVEIPKKFLAAVQYEWNNFAFGFYRAKLSLTYGTDSSAYATKWLFIFPWQLVSVIILILAIILVLLKKGIKRYNLWVIKTARNRGNFT